MDASKVNGRATAGKQRRSNGDRDGGGRFAKGNRHAWKRGRSGNPAGRRKRVPSLHHALVNKLLEADELAADGVPRSQRCPTVDELAESLLGLACEGDNVALNALRLLLERLDGRVPMKNDQSDDAAVDARMARDDVVARIQRLTDAARREEE